MKVYQIKVISGSVIHCSEDKDVQLFEALKCHLGILGIILDVTLQVLHFFLI